ncbi:MAG: AMP-binding protein [Prevotella sp.]|nr:AMP-binding protein [Prevotella sp.]
MVLEEFLKEWNNASDQVLVHTSGSTGKPKPMWVDKRRMMESARITCDFLGLKAGDTALLCLPLDYIAGKMMVVRSLIRGMKLIDVKPDGHPMRALPDGEQPVSFAAMVPMQVYNSLQTAEERDSLMQIGHLIIGGGAVDDALAAELKDFPNHVWSTYGMTETLSHIALRRLNGVDASEWYVPFPSVDVSLDKEECLVIDAPGVCATRLITNDIAEIAPDGRRFRILGRKDNVICSGGIKIQAEKVEQILSPYVRVPYIICRRKNEKFGEVAVLLLENGDVEEVRKICKGVLPKYWQPHDYVSINRIPMTETGKPARKLAEQMLTEMNSSLL